MMPRRILPIFFFCLFLMAHLLAGELFGQEVIRVGVFPFRLHVAEPDKVKQWPERVARIISTELARDDRIVVVEENQIREALAREGLREVDEPLAVEMGGKLDADYAVIGSITQIDGAFSLDARILNVHMRSVLGSAFATGKGVEQLERIARELSREISIKLLQKELITKVLIEGNRTIEEGAIRAHIKLKEGDLFSSRALQEDLKSVYQMGYFLDVRAEKRDWERGKAVVFVVEEKPTIREIRFSGNKALKTSELEEAAGLKPRSILNLDAVKEGVNKILKKYHDEAYFAAEVNYELQTPKEGEVVVHFKINENKKIRIKSIAFSGNRIFPDEKLKKLLPETQEEHFFSWVTKAGTYKEDVLERDLEAILAFYYQNGFYQAKIGKPQVIQDEKGIHLTIPVEEGRQFKVGKLDIQGELLAPKEKLLKMVDLSVGEILNRNKVKESVTRLTDWYADQGYAFVDISPQTFAQPESLLVDLIFEIKPGKKVYFERISILGNTKTRDKVIRRELKAEEGELYSLSALKNSRQNLNQLGYFKEVNLNTKKGSADDKLDLTVQVEEGPTGSFSIGGGYSSIDKLVAMAQISQTNLFGRGQKLVLAGQIGAVSQFYNLSFTEPWLFDTRISAGADVYRVMRDYDDFRVKKTGGGVRFGFPLFEQVRLFTLYKYEVVDVTDVKEDASIIILDQAGTSTTSLVSASLRRDTRDHFFDPSTGSDATLGIEYAGGPLGGSNYFTRYTANASWYTTPFWSLTFMLHGRLGYLQANQGHRVPLFERYRLGGINSIRGFKAYTVGPKAPNGEVIGGTKEMLFNAECIFPLIPAAKIKGLVFLDAGNAFDVGEPYRINGLRSSAGLGFRWMSPVGPLRIEWGYNLHPRKDEQRQGWDFSIGTVF